MLPSLSCAANHAPDATGVLALELHEHVAAAPTRVDTELGDIAQERSSGEGAGFIAPGLAFGRIRQRFCLRGWLNGISGVVFSRVTHGEMRQPGIEDDEGEGGDLPGAAGLCQGWDLFVFVDRSWRGERIAGIAATECVTCSPGPVDIGPPGPCPRQVTASKFPVIDHRPCHRIGPPEAHAAATHRSGILYRVIGHLVSADEGQPELGRDRSGWHVIWGYFPLVRGFLVRVPELRDHINTEATLVGGIGGIDIATGEMKAYSADHRQALRPVGGDDIVDPGLGDRTSHPDLGREAIGVGLIDDGGRNLKDLELRHGRNQLLLGAGVVEILGTPCRCHVKSGSADALAQGAEIDGCLKQLDEIRLPIGGRGHFGKGVDPVARPVAFAVIVGPPFVGRIPREPEHIENPLGFIRIRVAGIIHHRGRGWSLTGQPFELTQGEAVFDQRFA